MGYNRIKKYIYLEYLSSWQVLGFLKKHSAQQAWTKRFMD